jgi:hypothetical protein
VEGPTRCRAAPSTLRCAPLLLEGEDPPVRRSPRSQVGIGSRLQRAPFLWALQVTALQKILTLLQPTLRSNFSLMCEGARATPPKRGTPPPPPGAIPVMKRPTSPAPAEDQVSPSQGPSPSPKPTNICNSHHMVRVCMIKYIYRWTEVHLSLKLPKEAQLTCFHTSTHTHRTVGPAAQSEPPPRAVIIQITIISKISPKEEHSTHVFT